MERSERTFTITVFRSLLLGKVTYWNNFLSFVFKTQQKIFLNVLQFCTHKKLVDGLALLFSPKKRSFLSFIG
eukprot:UN22897